MLSRPHEKNRSGILRIAGRQGNVKTQNAQESTLRAGCDHYGFYWRAVRIGKCS